MEAPELGYYSDTLTLENGIKLPKIPWDDLFRPPYTFQNVSPGAPFRKHSSFYQAKEFRDLPWGNYPYCSTAEVSWLSVLGRSYCDHIVAGLPHVFIDVRQEWPDLLIESMHPEIDVKMIWAQKGIRNGGQPTGVLLMKRWDEINRKHNYRGWLTTPPLVGCSIHRTEKGLETVFPVFLLSQPYDVIYTGQGVIRMRDLRLSSDRIKDLFEHLRLFT